MILNISEKPSAFLVLTPEIVCGDLILFNIAGHQADILGTIAGYFVLGSQAPEKDDLSEIARATILGDRVVDNADAYLCLGDSDA